MSSRGDAENGELPCGELKRGQREHRCVETDMCS